jgi:hypothetical protein
MREKYEYGDLVECPPSGPHAGNRIGKIERIDLNKNGEKCFPFLIRYIDFPNEMPNQARVIPIKKINI